MTSLSPVPTLDLADWERAAEPGRADIAKALDAGLRQAGLFQLRGHGVSVEMRGELREFSRSFFALPRDRKARYRMTGPNSNGWRDPDLITTRRLDGIQRPPDLKEVFEVGAAHDTGRPDFDALHYPPNPSVADVPGFDRALARYTGQMVRVAQQTLRVLASVLGLPDDCFAAKTNRASWTQSLNWYPSLRTVGEARPGQLRVSAHSDFGTISLLDRQPGVGGLEFWHPEAGWSAPPYDPGSLTVVLGGLLQLWTDGRWNAVRHRVLAPSREAPDEELISLVFFFEADPDALVTPVAPPAGGGCGLRPAVAGEFIRAAAVQLRGDSQSVGL
jgi:isopenicillin N synthase-like dioxygenase